jgi:predicted Rossmann-fold nucleotide-binding protein
MSLHRVCVFAGWRPGTRAAYTAATRSVPGGIGILEELCEILTWAQLGLHAKPCELLDVGGYFQRLLGFLDHAVSEDFLPAEQRDMLLYAEDADALLQAFSRHRAPTLEKWIAHETT